MDRRWCTPEYHVPGLFFFFSFSLFIWSSYFVRQCRLWKACSCLKISRSHFKARDKSRLLIYLLVFILDRISPHRNCCEIMAQKEASKQISIPQKGFIHWKLLNFCYNERLSSKPRVGFSSSAYAVTRNLFAPNIFGRKAFLAIISSTTFFIHWNFSLLLDYFYNAKGCPPMEKTAKQNDNCAVGGGVGKVRTLLLIHLTL